MIQIEKPASMEQRLISKILKRIKFKKSWREIKLKRPNNNFRMKIQCVVNYSMHYNSSVY